MVKFTAEQLEQNKAIAALVKGIEVYENTDSFRYDGTTLERYVLRLKQVKELSKQYRKVNGEELRKEIKEDIDYILNRLSQLRRQLDADVTAITDRVLKGEY